MKVVLGISNRHVHLCEEDYNLLFDEEITKRNDLKQPGQYAANQMVTIVGPKNSIEKVRVLGPLRGYTQVEVSKTDCYKLGIDAPVRESGDLEGASKIIIKTDKNEIERDAAIIANRHIHVNNEIREENDLVGVSEVSIKVEGEKGGILEHVHLKDIDESVFELHLDTDDANAFNLKPNDELEIIK